MAVLVVVVGVLGLIGSSWPRQVMERWVNIHVLFGLLLCGLIAACYQRRFRQSPCMLPTDIRELSRHLSRVVYLILYIVIGVRLSIGIIDGIWHGAAADFSLFDERMRNGPDSAGFDPNDDFQQFVAAGLVVLVIVRVVAFRLWLHAVERAAHISDHGP
jgi:cytochrome b561